MSTSAALVSAGKKKIYTLADLPERKNEEPKKAQGKLGVRIATLSDLPESQATRAVARAFEQGAQQAKIKLDEACRTFDDAKSTLGEARETLKDARTVMQSSQATLHEAVEVNRTSEQSVLEALELTRRLEVLQIKTGEQIAALRQKSERQIARQDDEIRNLQILRDQLILNRNAQIAMEGRVVQQYFVDWCLWITIIALAAIVIVGAVFLLL